MSHISNFSVAIRTLGTNPGLLKRELESIFAQTLKPERVVIYIADGYPEPDFRVRDELYIHVRKGMVAQRALEYREIDSPLILLLDDDVVLAPDSAERLINALETHNLDCIAPDTFANHKMSAKQKVYSLLSNLTYSHSDPNWAFKVHRNGSFSYLKNPPTGVVMSQSAAGPCSLWRKEAFLRTRLKDELWLDDLGFAYGDDQLLFFKLHHMGGRLGVFFDSGVDHVGAKTASAAYKRDPQRFYLRAKAMKLVWHRSQMSWRKNRLDRLYTAWCFWLKMALTFPAIVAAAVATRNWRIPYLHLKGLAAPQAAPQTEAPQTPHVGGSPS